MGSARIGIGCVGVATCLLGTRVAAAAADSDSRAPGPHRIQASLGGEAATTLIDEDGHWDDSGVGLTLGAAYGYGLFHALEVDAGATYLDLGTAGDWPVNSPVHLRALLPWVGIRPHADFPGLLDVGITGKFGGYFLWATNVPDDTNQFSKHTHPYRGTYLALSPDLRFFVSPRWAVSVALDAMLGTAHDTAPVRGYYLQDNTTLIALGASAGVVLSL